MEPNQIKIIINYKENKISYFFREKNQEWNPVATESELARKNYVFASISEKAPEILQIINDQYNVCNRGVDIYFQGSGKDYNTLKSIIEENFSDDNIHCYQIKTSIVVAGKIGSGKSTLIEEIIKRQGKMFRFFRNNNIDGYADTDSTTIWYEIPGIDIGKENVAAAMKYFDLLTENGITNLIYCFSTNKVEKLEEQFIRHVQEKYPNIKILIVLTKCLEDESVSVLSEHVIKNIGNLKVIPILAKEYKTRRGLIQAYGLEEIMHYILGGKAL